METFRDGQERVDVSQEMRRDLAHWGHGRRLTVYGEVERLFEKDYQRGCLTNELFKNNAVMCMGLEEIGDVLAGKAWSLQQNFVGDSKKQGPIKEFLQNKTLPDIQSLCERYGASPKMDAAALLKFLKEKSQNLFRMSSDPAMDRLQREQAAKSLAELQSELARAMSALPWRMDRLKELARNLKKKHERFIVLFARAQSQTLSYEEQYELRMLMNEMCETPQALSSHVSRIDLALAGYDAALKDLSQSLLGLVIGRAYFWHKQYHGILELDDLIVEGNLGVDRGIDLFDWRIYRTRLTTYLMNWIDQRMRRALQQEAKRRQREGMSLDKPLGEDGDATQGDLQADKREPDILDSVQKTEAVSAFTAAINALAQGKFYRESKYGIDTVDRIDTRRWAAVLMLRQGIMVDGILTTEEAQRLAVIQRRSSSEAGMHAALFLEEAGEVMGITRERVRQIEAQAWQLLDKRVIPHLTNGTHLELMMRLALGAAYADEEP